MATDAALTQRWRIVPQFQGQDGPDHAIGVRKGWNYVRTFYEEGDIRFVLAARQEWLVCSTSYSAEANRPGRRFREVKTAPIGLVHGGNRERCNLHGGCA